MIAKAEWGEGPWQDEPDELFWTDETTGIQCAILRNFEVSGTLNGYVRVDGTSFEGKTMHDDCASDLDVHGGVTFPLSPERNIPSLGGGYWIGFDCAHAWDFSPVTEAIVKLAVKDGVMSSMQTSEIFRECVYRDINYVKKECESLAKQVKYAQLSLEPEEISEENTK